MSSRCACCAYHSGNASVANSVRRPADVGWSEKLAKKRNKQAVGLAKLDGRKEPYPDVPTRTASASLQNFDEISIGLGPVAPKATPQRIINKLNREVAHISSQPDAREKFNQTGIFAMTGTPGEFAAFIRREAAR